MQDVYIKQIDAKIVFDTEEARQPKLSIDEQIQHLMEDHGVLFDIKGTSAAKEFLSKNNYYHKIKAYASNYSVYTGSDHPLKGKYCDLDFEYLVELSVIDMRLRRIIIEMSLDIEHFLKAQLINDITNNTKEDAYNIVDRFFAIISEEKRRDIAAKVENYYYKRYNQQNLRKLPAWELVEVLSFGDFITLYELYYSLYPSKTSLNNNLKPIQWLRNAAAHNNCIINDLTIPTEPFFEINKKVNTFVSKINGISAKAREKKLSNRSMHDFIVMLYVFNRVCSENVKQHTMENLKDFVDGRMVYHKNYFTKNALLQSNYIFFKKVVDYCASNVVY